MMVSIMSFLSPYRKIRFNYSYNDSSLSVGNFKILLITMNDRSCSLFFFSRESERIVKYIAVNYTLLLLISAFIRYPIHDVS